MRGRNGLDAVAQRRRIVVEVDQRAPAPQLAPDRGEAQIVGAEIAFIENLGPQHEGVGAVETPAPPVERADEVAARPTALDDLHPTVAARVVVGANAVIVEPDDDDRLVEDLVLHEVASRRDFLESARHLPYPGPEQ